MASVHSINVSLCRKTLHSMSHVNNLHPCTRVTLHRSLSSFQIQCAGSRSNPSTFEEAVSEISDGIRKGTVAVGSGDLVAAFLEHMAEKRDIGHVKFAPTSLSVESEIKMLGLPRDSEALWADVFIDQADQVHVTDGIVSYIVGTGQNGPQVGQPDIPVVQKMAGAARKIILLTHQSGDITSTRLSGQLPILIEGDELEWEECAEEVDDMFLGDGEITRRSNNEEANCRGMPDPVITSDGDMILDVAFYKDLRLYGESVPYRDITRAIEGIEGVVVSGLVQCSSKYKDSITIYQVLGDDRKLITTYIH